MQKKTGPFCWATEFGYAFCLTRVFTEDYGMNYIQV